jgi:hypothetical protein
MPHRIQSGAAQMAIMGIAWALLTTGGSACAPVEDVVGVVGAAPPDAGTSPGACVADAPLKMRAESEPVTASAAEVESSDDTEWQLVRRGQYVSLEGQGYLNLRWQIEYRAKAGLITPPLFSAVSGTWLHVGGGGGKNLGDPEPGTSGTFMGNPEEGISFMPEGVPTPWQNEFYYLDGQVTIELNETDGLYNIVVSAQSYAEVTSPGWGVYDPGVVCDPA